MNGINATNGRHLAGIEHLRQSLRDLLTTPIGSRVMRRDYGSRLFDLVDGPISQGWKMECYAAVAEAIRKWEPRFRVIQMEAVNVSAGQMTFDLKGEYLPDGSVLTLEGIVIG